MLKRKGIVFQTLLWTFLAVEIQIRNFRINLYRTCVNDRIVIKKQNYKKSKLV